MSYIGAGRGKAAQSVQYDIDAQNAELRTGGTPTWRHNNATLLPLNVSARSHGALGQANGVAIFADKASSEQAFLAELERPKYANMTLGQLVNQFIPTYIIPPPEWDEEKNAPILPHNEPETGMDVNKPVTDKQNLLNLVSTKLGWQAGQVETLVKDADSEAPETSTVSNNNLLINGKTAVHVDSGGVLNTIDVCLTTVPMVGVIPIPYGNVAKAEDISGVADSVKIQGNGAAHIKCTFTKSKGDSPGDKKGIISGTVEQKAEFITCSTNVLIEGKPAVRQGDLMISNNKNTPPSPLRQPGGANPQGLRINKRGNTQLQTNDSRAVIVVNSQQGRMLSGQGTFTFTQAAEQSERRLDQGE
ncbi:DUF4150 domain-containing protein [Pseudoalteromonas fenneropenaei]|uniref:DUF4150 domain-containing protein n=1 Tax=Pseudoalteromonas fenneropenaei TaxID=1737459 RepID=A0ABV7CHM3_9GAMM